MPGEIGVPAYGLLVAAVLLAATSQAPTGVGFGLIAGPFLLLVIDGREAVLVSAALSLVVSAGLVPRLLPEVDRQAWRWLSLGAIAGLPLGVLVLATLEVAHVKLAAGVVVVLSVATLLAPRTIPLNRARPAGVAAGLVSGLLSGCLAIPGPPAAAFLGARRASKATLRGTMLAFFCVVFPLTIGLQATILPVASGTLALCLVLVLPALLGIGIGDRLVRYVNEVLYRRLLVALLAAIAIALLVPGVRDTLG